MGVKSLLLFVPLQLAVSYSKGLNSKSSAYVSPTSFHKCKRRKIWVSSLWF